MPCVWGGEERGCHHCLTSRQNGKKQVKRRKGVMKLEFNVQGLNKTDFRSSFGSKHIMQSLQSRNHKCMNTLILLAADTILTSSILNSVGYCQQHVIADKVYSLNVTVNSVTVFISREA